MVALQVGYDEGGRPHSGLRNGARAKRAVSVAEQHRHLAVAVKPNYVRDTVAVGIPHCHPRGAEIRVVAPGVKSGGGGPRCVDDFGTCQAHQEESCGNDVSSHGIVYLLVLTRTITPPERSGTTMSGRPAEAGCPCRFTATTLPGFGPAPI